MSALTSASERVPNSEWQRLPTPPMPSTDASAWGLGGIVVVSSVDNATYPDGSGVGPQWHVSVSGRKGRPTDRECRRALRAFGMVGAEEDNHHPGRARHFWRPFDRTKRVDCECKATERTVVEPDGYRWTTPVSGRCTGCEYALFSDKACPIHAAPEGKL